MVACDLGMGETFQYFLLFIQLFECGSFLPSAEYGTWARAVRALQRASICLASGTGQIVIQAPRIAADGEQAAEWPRQIPSV